MLENKKNGLTKLGPQIKSGIFPRMEPDTKAYRVLNGNEIRVSRHVVCSEGKFKPDGNVKEPMPTLHEEYNELPDVFEI